MIGSNIRARREEKGLTQVALAEAVGSIQSTISGIETGDKNPSVDMLVRLAQALGCSVDSLLHSGSGNNGGGVAAEAPAFNGANGS